MTPAVFLASAFDQESPLYKVFFEADGINTTITATSDWKCLPIHKVNLETVTQHFRNAHHFSFQVFHFAGHAIDKDLQFNDRMPTMEEMESTATYLVNVGGLAQIIKAIHPIQLVFLNGCSTKTQVDAFKNAGIPAVIYTCKPLNDQLGIWFAQQFYLAFFKENNTLQQAFEIANGFINGKKSNFPNNGIDPNIKGNMNRGISSLDPLPDVPENELYELSASDDFKNMRWSDWPTIKQQDGPIKLAGAQADPLDLQSKQIPDSVIHRCDRSDELFEIHEFLDKLAAKKSTGPYFFFVHEKSEARPLSLIKRLEVYGASEFCEEYSNYNAEVFIWKNLKLPHRKLLQQAGRCKSRLFEIYDADLFKCPLDETNNTFTFLPSEHGDKVFLIHHDLTELELESAADLKLLLEFYMDEFSRKVKSELGARLAIIFSCQYIGDREDFKTLFEELSNDARFVNKVKNLTDMMPIKITNVVAWKEKIFKDRNFPIPPDTKDLFPFEENEKKDMKEVQEILVKKLIEYNRQIK